MVAEALRATGLDPGLLSLELTETLLLGDHDSVDHILRSLKALGVQLVLDDFGTGHSSLGTVATLPLDALKVDRSFVASLAAEPRRSPIAEAIVAMAKALSLVVIGEGAETPEQVQALSRLGCDLAQGYAFSPPVDADSIGVWLGNGARLTNG
jgi:EAL domain-containing protein (putative c-di-GMP-specific phosphodiesterase class I)